MTPAQIIMLLIFLGIAISLVIVDVTLFTKKEPVVEATEIILPTQDLRPRNSNCLYWKYLVPNDNNQMCVMGTVASKTGDTYSMGGDIFVVSFDTGSEANKKFYVIIYMKFHPGEESWSPGNWDVFTERFKLLESGTCIGITGNVINRKFYRTDPTDTYYITINYPEEIHKLDNCPKQ